MLHRAAVLCLAILACIGLSHAQDGTLDPSWDEDGRVITTLGEFDDSAYGIAVARSGRIVVVGQTYQEGRYGFFVARYLPNGALDETFGDNGVTTTFFGTSDAKARSVTIQQDGSIVVAGIGMVDGNEVFTLARYNDKTGRLDETFNGTGFVHTRIGLGWCGAHAVAMHTEGRIIAAGYAQQGPDMVMAIVRYDNAGQPDPTFGANGIVTTQFSIGNDIAYALSVFGEDDIYIAGSSRRTGSNTDIAIARLKSSGELDGSFGTDGKFRHASIGTTNEWGYGMTVQRDGKPVVVGATSNLLHDAIITRYTMRGELDTDFGNTGIVTRDFGVGADGGQAGAVIEQPDGKLLVAGFHTSGNTSSFALLRYLSNGIPDPEFGESGMVSTNFGGSDDNGRAMALQPDGKILVAGQSHNGTQNRIAIARYNNPSVAGPSSVYASQVASPKIVPNPFRTSTTLVFEHDLVEPSVSLFNALGERVSCTTTYTANQLHVAAPGLPTGIYVVLVVEPSGRRTVQTVAVQR